MSWQNEVTTALENNQYDIVSQFYEQLIERETTEISYYWYRIILSFARKRRRSTSYLVICLHSRR